LLFSEQKGGGETCFLLLASLAISQPFANLFTFPLPELAISKFPSSLLLKVPLKPSFESSPQAFFEKFPSSLL
tara:strand:- start:292 stop:510 length:219 start_codon:yes stop_codon:yes gene_type:complete